MIESVHFRNFKVLRNATLPLGRFTLIIGPNGSGKSTALQGLQIPRFPQGYDYSSIVSAGAYTPGGDSSEISFKWGEPFQGFETKVIWKLSVQLKHSGPDGVSNSKRIAFEQDLSRLRVYSLDATQIAMPVALVPGDELQGNGAHLVGVLDQLRDQDEARFEALNEALGRWLPEFDRVLFETPQSGFRALMLRTRREGYKIKAKDLSQGTLLALAMLTLAYLPSPPSIVCLEEPDHGIHPRLMRQVQDAFYRLSFPENYEEKRAPVQVIATTHSPYLLDLFRDNPEQIVIAQKTDDGGKFERLSEKPYIDEILQGSPALGEIWYTGILGGVPNYA
jgi:predicted ATPase